MASGNYGTVRPADVSLNDIEVFLHYTPSRNNIGDTTLTKLNTNEVLSEVNNPNNTNNVEIFGGMYTLTLPSTLFSIKGIYTLHIKPVEIRTRILDCGVLSAKSEIKGLIFDTASQNLNSTFTSRFQNGGLVGYRIEYLNTTNSTSGAKVRNTFRLITSNNRVDVVNQNLTNTNQKAVRYNFNDNSTLVFCTVTPSSASNVKPNVLPFIGEPNQEVIITNTFFNPVMIEIEMVEHDLETIAYGLYGPQSKSLEDGIYTQYTFDNSIYKQYNLFEIKDQFTGAPLFEVKEPRLEIDFTKNFDDISQI
jgi:hypothetical protein|tara:strand:+ start:3149 stop:4066 length:918 start_codon:yes stop_codon:yes gene_type:complete